MSGNGSIGPTAQLIPLDQLHESQSNPRTHFGGLEDLGRSLLSGQLMPLIVRERAKGGYEVAAGHRRLRAAKLMADGGWVSLKTLRCEVHDLSDARFHEILVFENGQRDEVHPLDEARGFRLLMAEDGYDVAKLVERAGRSESYVRERLLLLRLRREAQDLFYAGIITLQHAVQLARLTQAEQLRAIDRKNGGLYEPDSACVDLQHQMLPELQDQRKPVSPRELASWIVSHCRFNPTAKDVRDLFPETALQLEQAETVVHLTADTFVQPEARDERERIYGPKSWKRADGQPDTHIGGRKASKECASAVTGVIVVGPGRGQAFRVCVAKDECRIHWPESKKPASAKRAESKARAEAEKDQRRREAEEEARTRWKKAEPAILQALAARVRKLPAGAKGPLAKVLVDDLTPRYDFRRKAKLVPPGRSAEDLVRHLAYVVLQDAATGYHAAQEFPRLAKRLGVDVAQVLAAAAEV